MTDERKKSSNVVWHQGMIDRRQREALNGHKSAILWFTGLSGSGKSTLAHAVEEKLYEMGCRTSVLDGDNIRHGLCGDLGFSDEDRVENIRRVAETAKLFIDAGLIVLVSFISPFRSERRLARSLMEEGEFTEIYVDTPLSVAEDRDPKGLYARARSGEIRNFTGIDSPYETPETAEVRLDTVTHGAEELADQLIDYLRMKGRLDAD